MLGRGRRLEGDNKIYLLALESFWESHTKLPNYLSLAKNYSPGYFGHWDNWEILSLLRITVYSANNWGSVDRSERGKVGWTAVQQFPGSMQQGVG